MVKLRDLVAGDVLIADQGFTCLSPGPHKVHGHDDMLFVVCDEGRHYLEGQEDHPGEDLVGLTRSVN